MSGYKRKLHHENKLNSVNDINWLVEHLKSVGLLYRQSMRADIMEEGIFVMLEIECSENSEQL